MDLGLRGLKALVTGGTRGIGRAIAETLAAEGCHVAICARNAKDVTATIAALTARSVKATGAAVDVSDGPMLKAWVAEAAAALNGLDIIVANVSAMAVSDDDEGWSSGFDARNKAAEAQRLIADGKDPLSERAKQNETPTFEKMAEDVIASLEQGFRNEKHRKQWRSTLQTYAESLRRLAGSP